MLGGLFKNMLGSNLTRFKKDRLYLLWDLEAEHLNLFTSKPWQIAFAVANNKEILDIQVRYIHWDDLNVSPDAARITGFSRKTYRENAKPADEVLAEFEEKLYDEKYHSMFHNGLNYDIYIHNLWRRLLGKESDYSYLSRCYDTSAILKGYKKGWELDLDNFTQWQMQMNNHVERGLKTNLEQMGKEFKIDHDFTTLHDAESDINLMYKVFKEILYKYDF